MIVPARLLGLLGLLAPLVLGVVPRALAQDEPATPGDEPTAEEPDERQLDAQGPAPDEQEPVEVTPEPQPGPTPDRGALGRPQPTLHGELALSLEDALRMGLENNLDVEVDRYSPYIVYEDVEQAWGAYDPTLYSDFSYQSTQLQNSFLITGQPESSKRDT